MYLLPEISLSNNYIYEGRPIGTTVGFLSSNKSQILSANTSMLFVAITNCLNLIPNPNQKFNHNQEGTKKIKLRII